MEKTRRNGRLPREVWVAALTQEGIVGTTLEEVVASAVRKLERHAAPYEPDIVCLPETFHVTGLRGKSLSVEEAAEQPLGALTRPFAEFARAHHCYVLCPIYTRQEGRLYNAAVLIDRRGQVQGEYRKAHPTEGEIEDGLFPGPLDPPVFPLDFGTIGVQICFDIQWPEGWRSLEAKGAEIVFWPSAFAGGQMLNAKAWAHHYAVVSSTQKDTSKICAMSGEEVARSGRWQSWGCCAPLNLEMAFLHTWPYVGRFPEIEARYGRRVRIRTLHEEEFSIIESLDADLRVGEVLAEFGMKTHREHIRSAEVAQEQCRAGAVGV